MVGGPVIVGWLGRIVVGALTDRYGGRVMFPVISAITIIFALWPFTRLVHVFSAPLGYLTRPYIVYRSRDDKQLGSHSPRAGWERINK